MSQVHVIAELSFKLERRESFLAAFRKLEPLVRAEDGCIEYRGAVEVPTGISAQTPVRDGVLLVIEKWASEAARAAHLHAPHMDAFGATTRDMMTARVIRIARDISPAA